MTRKMPLTQEDEEDAQRRSAARRAASRVNANPATPGSLRRTTAWSASRCACFIPSSPCCHDDHIIICDGGIWDVQVAS